MPDTNIVSLVGRLNKAANEVRDADLSILLADASIKIVQLSGAESAPAPVVSTERGSAKELELLRISLARVAQALGVQSIILPFTGKAYEELVALARNEARGWNAICAGILADIEAREALQRQSLKVALEGVKAMLNNGDPDEAAQALGALSPFFTNADGTGWGDYFKAMEQIEIGEPYTAGVMYLDNLIESLKVED